MSWERLTPLTSEEAGLRSGCLTCGPQPVALPQDAVIAVGFGNAGVTRDGVEVWCENDCEDGQYWECRDAEAAAAEDPEHDWRIFYHGPLSEAEYQRQDGQWVLVKKGQGFA